MSQRQMEAQVFETEDVDSSGVDTAEEYHTKRRAEAKQSEDIIETELHPQMAFERFAGKLFTGPSSKEQEALRAVSSRRSEYASMGAGGAAFESPLDRYNRLRREVADFETELAELAKESQADDLKSAAAATIAGELGEMQQTLGGLVNNQALRPFLVDGATDADLVQQKHMVDRLLQRLEAEGRRDGAAGAAGAADGAAGGSVTYELFYNPQKDAGRRQMNISDLDRRLASLEGVLGTLPDDKALGYPDVQTAIESLRTRMEFLDQSRLDSVYRRVKSLMADLDLLQKSQDKMQGDKSSKHQAKVDRIFDMMARWDEAAQQLPAVIARLHSLRELHEESAGTVLRVQEVDTQLGALDRQQKSNRDALDRVSANLEKNASAMAANVQSLESRFDTLAKKIALLEGSN